MEQKGKLKSLKQALTDFVILFFMFIIKDLFIVAWNYERVFKLNVIYLSLKIKQSSNYWKLIILIRLYY